MKTRFLAWLILISPGLLCAQSGNGRKPMGRDVLLHQGHNTGKRART